jgi:hypothetical protein
MMLYWLISKTTNLHPYKKIMKEIKKTKPEIDFSYDNEIDLFELFQKIWKWKWVTVSFILIFCIITFCYVKSTPVTYTTEANMRIGKIAGVLIEQISGVEIYLQLDVFNRNDICLTNASFKNEVKNNIIKISCTANSQNIAFSCLEKATNNLLYRHNNIYKKALKKFNENITSIKTKIVIEPVYLLDTYTFPSTLMIKPEIPINPDNKKLSLKIAVTFFSSLFLGIFLSLFIDYILRHRMKN